MGNTFIARTFLAELDLLFFGQLFHTVARSEVSAFRFQAFHMCGNIGLFPTFNSHKAPPQDCGGRCFGISPAADTFLCHARHWQKSLLVGMIQDLRQLRLLDCGNE